MNKSINGFHSMVSKNRKGIQKKYTVLVEYDEYDGDCFDDDTVLEEQ
jgi:hypothetical protein